MTSTSSIATQIYPSSVFSFLKRVFILEESSFSEDLSEFFSQQACEVKLLGEVNALRADLDRFKPHLILVSAEWMQATQFSPHFLNEMLPDACLVIVGDNFESCHQYYPSKLFSGWLVRSHFSHDYLKLILQQVIELKKLKREQTQLQECLHKSQEALEQNDQELENLFQSRATFVEQLSANIQKPINQLIQFAHIGLQRMQRRQFTQVGHYLAEVKMITEEMVSMIQEIKEISLLKSGESRFHLEEIDMVEFLRGIRRQFQPIADSRDIALRFQNQLHFPLVLGDFNQLSKVLSTLLSHILKRLPKNGEIRLKTDQTESHFMMTLEHPNWGEEELQNHQIGDFFNPQNFNSQKKNVGFGISICKELMLGQNGDILLTQDPLTKELKFVLTLPLAGSFLDH